MIIYVLVIPGLPSFKAEYIFTSAFSIMNKIENKLEYKQMKTLVFTIWDLKTPVFNYKQFSLTLVSLGPVL